MKVEVTRVHRNHKGTLAETSLRGVCTPPSKTHTQKETEKTHLHHTPTYHTLTHRENPPHTDLSVVRPPTLGTACTTSQNLPGRRPPCAQPRCVCLLPTSHP